MNAVTANLTAILGAGSWGTALAILLARNGTPVKLWGHEPEHMQRLREQRCNADFLPDIAFPPGLEPIVALPETLASAEHVLVAVPSHAFRELLVQLRPIMDAGQGLIWATKGLEMQSGKLLHEVAQEILGSRRPLAVVSGPTFAGEVARGLPTAATVASTDAAFATQVANLFHGESFRAYTSEDMIGVQLGGAAKNVLAIAAGIADGLGFGANARAALITRGLAEILRLGLRLGGQQETFMGLAGVGDLVLTCTDNQSRNRRFGLALAAGQSPDQARAEIGQVVEGAQAAQVVTRMARAQGVEMPITEQVFRVLEEQLDPREAVHALFCRAQKAEFD